MTSSGRNPSPSAHHESAGRQNLFHLYPNAVPAPVLEGVPQAQLGESLRLRLAAAGALAPSLLGTLRERARRSRAVDARRIWRAREPVLAALIAALTATVAVVALSARGGADIQSSTTAQAERQPASDAYHEHRAPSLRAGGGSRGAAPVGRKPRSRRREVDARPRHAQRLAAQPVAQPPPEMPTVPADRDVPQRVAPPNPAPPPPADPAATEFGFER